ADVDDLSSPALPVRRSRALRHLPSFPTRRSSDLVNTGAPVRRWTSAAISMWALARGVMPSWSVATLTRPARAGLVKVATDHDGIDRKSTRLNSSHRTISYAVFCLKKKTKSHQLLT